MTLEHASGRIPPPNAEITIGEKVDRAKTEMQQILMSVFHPEASRVLKGLLAGAEQNPQGLLLEEKGDGRSSGSVLLAAGLALDEELRSIAGMIEVGCFFITGKHAHYLSFHCPGGVFEIGRAPQRFLVLPDTPYHYDPRQMAVVAVWSLSKQPGHQAKGETELLSLEDALQKWEETVQKRNLIYEIRRCQLPRGIKINLRKKKALR